MTNFFKWLLFISSYAPLYVLLAINNYNFSCTPLSFIKQVSGNAQHLIFWIVIIFLFIISMVSVIYFKFISLNERRSLTELKPINENVLTYLIPFVIPLIEMDINSLNSLLVNAILFLIIGILYVKSDLVYINILLILIGFRVYIDSVGNVVITDYKKNDLRTSINASEDLLCRKVIKGVYLVRRQKN